MKTINTVGQISSQVSHRLKAGAVAATSFGAAPAAITTIFAVHGSVTFAMVSALLLPIMIIFIVICPAIWSRKPARRKAALDVIDRLLGRQSKKATGPHLAPTHPRPSKRAGKQVEHRQNQHTRQPAKRQPS